MIPHYSSILLLLSIPFAFTSSSSPEATPTLAPRDNPAPIIGRQIPIAPASSSTASNGRTSSTSATISIPNNAPVGGLSFTNPAITAAVSYHKIMANNPITFGWNYTNLYITPSALTFQAHCSANGFTYPVGPTSGIAGSNTQLVWDPHAYLQSPNAINFAQASYTLRVFDSRGLNAAPTPGMFDGNNALVAFALYSPAAYTPLSEGWTCVGCSWGRSIGEYMNHPLLVALPVTVSLILIGGAGIFNR